MRLAVVLGTRPEIIKMGSILRVCQERQANFFLVHTGQHYSHEMDRVFFEQLELPEPRYHLDVGSGRHGAQTARMLTGIEEVFLKDRPDVVLVQGDTNSVLAGAVAAAKMQIAVGHVEAGLRSGDRSMPEELNRLMVDHVSDYLFAPTEPSAATLRAEGLPASRIFVTGNTVVDAVLQNRDIAIRRSEALARLHLQPNRFLLMTAHRQENVDHPQRFQGILSGARRLGESLGARVVYPIHPRSRKMLTDLNLDASGIDLISPLDFLDFLCLQAQAHLVLTDSGGVQEETCVLHVPCVTLRDNTERPETLEVGSNVLAGADPERIVAQGLAQVRRSREWTHPYGDGHAGERILAILAETGGTRR